MTQLHAQPYDIDATGFYFDDLKQYQTKAKANKNRYGQPVEEYEIQLIDAESIDCDLAKAWGLNQINFAAYFDAVNSWDDFEKQQFIIAVGEGGYTFDYKTVSASDFDVDIYFVNSMKELAEQFVDEGLYGEIPDSLQYYIDTDAMARDLAADYSETTIAGESIIYRLA